MRLRNVPGAREVMIENEYVFTEPEGMKGTWSQVFGNPIRIEIGMGKGTFITTLAANNPDINYVGIEKYSSVLLRAVEKQDELQLPNLRFIRMDAEAICEVFGEGEVDRIYLNFSDPWPKDRHAKRRLTSRQFMARYDIILKPDGQVEFKTDNKNLFNFFSLYFLSTINFFIYILYLLNSKKAREFINKKKNEITLYMK